MGGEEAHRHRGWSPGLGLQGGKGDWKDKGTELARVLQEATVCHLGVF